ncbi:MAG: transcriptional regulator [Paenibacillaceae bacterium]|jgi:AcrR family transcriptional regulator|nr:transcriptional regulator [Paenibacillaceae bacterium]
MVRYKKSDEKRRLILHAAFQALAELGYDAVTLQIIADYAKVSKGVVHYYYNSKDAVLTELLLWLTGRIYEKECAAVQEQSTAGGKLAAYLDSVFVAPEKNRSFYRVYLDFLAKATRNPAYREINQRFYGNCRSISTEIVLQGQREGVFHAGLDIDGTAAAIRAIIDGCLIQWLMTDRDGLHSVYKDICHQAVLKLLTPP